MPIVPVVLVRVTALPRIVPVPEILPEPPALSVTLAPACPMVLLAAMAPLPAV